MDEAYQIYAKALLNYVRRLTYARGLSEAAVDTEGVVQETFLHLFSYPEKVHNPMGWLCTVARRIVASCHAEALRSAYGDPGEHIDRGTARWSSIAPTAELEDILAVSEVMDALAALPDRQRTAVYLRHVQGWSLAEIGAYLDCAAATAGVHIHRARLALAHEKVSVGAERGVIAGGTPAQTLSRRMTHQFVPVALMMAITIYLWVTHGLDLATLAMGIMTALHTGVTEVWPAIRSRRRRPRQPDSRSPSD